MHYNSKSIFYCFHCMEVIDSTQQICPFCGKPVQNLKANERALPPGTVLAGKYLLGEILGEGGFGITYIGIDLNLHLKVAVKEYFPASFASRSISASSDYNIRIISGPSEALYRKGLDDYTREANRLAQFASLPGIVSVLNFFYENNTAYMIMEYVDGITLKEYLKLHNEHLPWQDTLALLHPIILSLEEVHKAGIIHRDISPDNIMISRNHEMILIDFGAARNIDQEQQNKTVILKKGFAPPEQYQSNGDQGPWSDTYSFCATIYRIISGNKPPDSLDIAAGTVPLIPLKTLAKDIPDFLDAAIQQGLQTDISVRIKSMEELERYLYQGKRVQKKINGKKLNKFLLTLCSIISFLIILIFIGLLIQNQMANRNVIVQEESTIAANNTDEEAAVSGHTSSASAPEPDAENSIPTIDNASEAEQGNDTDTKYEMLPDTTNLSYEDTEDGIIITAVDSSITEVVIPGQIDGKPVKVLRGLNTNVTSVVIKYGTETIAAESFRNCVYLESLYIPASVTTIETGTFVNCLNLNEIVVSPDNPAFYSENGKLYTQDGELILG